MANLFIFANNATTTLTSNVSAGTTTLNVTSGATFPFPGSGQQFAATLISAANPLVTEVVYVTANSANQFTVVRGQEGTTAVSFVIGDIVQHEMTAGVESFFRQATQCIGRTIVSITSTGTWTCPAGVFLAKFRLRGGGGPGGYNTVYAGGGGGSGGYAEGIFAVTPGTVYMINIGAGGVSDSTNGGTTSIPALGIQATGGTTGGGGTEITNAGGSPGAGSGGQFNDYGAYGTDGIQSTASPGGIGGNGGGPGGGRGATGFQTGVNATGYGGGGGGGGSNGAGSGASGGNGAAGVVVIEY